MCNKVSVGERFCSAGYGLFVRVFLCEFYEHMLCSTGYQIFGVQKVVVFVNYRYLISGDVSLEGYY